MVPIPWAVRPTRRAGRGRPPGRPMPCRTRPLAGPSVEPIPSLPRARGGPRPAGGIARAERVPDHLRPELAALLRRYPHRNHQLRALGVDKEAMVAHLATGIDRDDALCLLEVRAGRLEGLLQAVPDAGLSRQLGRRMWSVRHLLAADDGRAGIARRLVEALVDALDGRTDLVTARVASGDLGAINALERQGFRLVTGEIAGVVRPVREVGACPAGLAIGPMAPGDVDDVATIAGRSHVHNRFAYDPRIDRDEARRLYEDLIRRYAENPDATTLVARGRDGAVRGFIASRVNRAFSRAVGRTLASLDFIGVHPDVRTRGVGDALNRHALAGMRAAGVHAATVRTLMNNFEALGVLRKLGMRITSSNVVLHRWYG